MKTISLSCFSLFLVSCASLQFNLEEEQQLPSKAHARGLSFQNAILAITGYDGNYWFRLNSMGNDTISGMVNANDLRDVEVLSNNTIFFLNSGDNGLVYKYNILTNSLVQSLDTIGVFLDGIDFWDTEPFKGIVFGDPINNEFFIARTNSAKDSWEYLHNTPKPLPGEAGFAASGTNIHTISDSVVYIGTGGCDTPRLLYSYNNGDTWDAKITPMKGGPTHGIYSLYFWNTHQGIIIGGSYKDSTDNENMCFYTEDGGESWKNRSKGLPGYCSCVAAFENLTVVTGRNGTYFSLNYGKTWKHLTENPYYSCVVTQEKIYLSGKGGKYAIYSYSLG